MSSTEFTIADHSVLVAVKLDEHAAALIEWGAELAHRTGMSLEIVTVQEPHPAYFAPLSMGAIEDFVVALEGEAMRVAESALHGLTEVHARNIKVKAHVVSGHGPQAIAKQAVRSDAAVIVVGAAASSHRFVPKGFSTALTLLAEAPVPVLVIPLGTSAKLKSERNTIIFADDLSPRTEMAVTQSLKFAAALGRADFYHVHVNALTKEVLEASVTSAAASAHVQAAGLSIKELQTQVSTVLQQKLHDRSCKSQPLLEASAGKYTPVIKDGEVRRELRESVSKLQPSLLMFGRHRKFHYRSFMIGHVPFYAMLELQLPLVVFPTEE